MKPCNSYISRASIKLTRLFFPQEDICLASRLPFFKSSPIKSFLLPSLFAHFTCTHNFLRCSKPSPHSILFLHKTWTEFFPPQTKMQRKWSLSLFILAFYTRTHSPPTSTFIFPPFRSGKCPHQPRKPSP